MGFSHVLQDSFTNGLFLFWSNSPRVSIHQFLVTMRETWVFDWPKNAQRGSLTSVFETLLSEKKTEFGIFLSYYTRAAGAIAENVRLLEVTAAKPALRGSIWLGFHKVYYNACLNIHESDPEKIRVDFAANRSEEKLVLTGPDIPEREPDEL